MLRVQVEFKFYRCTREYLSTSDRAQLNRRHRSLDFVGAVGCWRCMSNVLPDERRICHGGRYQRYATTGIGIRFAKVKFETSSARAPNPTCLVLNFEFSFDDGSCPNAYSSSFLCVFSRCWVSRCVAMVYVRVRLNYSV